MKNSEVVDNFLTLLREAETHCAFVSGLLKQTNDETQDILHYLELENPNYKERAKCATKLQKVRQQRREYKDELEEFTDIAEFVKENQQIIHRLEQLLGKIRKVEKYHAERHYIPRCKERD